MGYPELTIANVGAVLRGCGEPDELMILSGMCGNNHTAGFVLRRLIGLGAGVREVWHTATQWESETVSRRKLESATGMLKNFGLTVEVKPLNGNVMRPVNHYAIDAEVFWSMLGTFLEVRGVTDETYIRECLKCTSASVQNVHPRMDEMYALTLENLSIDSKKESNISLPAGETEKREREIYKLDAIAKKFSNYEKHRETLNGYVIRLGEVRVREAIKAVEGTAVDWAFVVNRLNANNGAKTSPNSAPPPLDDGELLSGKYADFFKR